MKELRVSISIFLMLILTCVIASPMLREKKEYHEVNIAYMSNKKETSEKVLPANTIGFFDVKGEVKEQ